MLEAGLLVTVNSDDPAYFGGYVDDNFAQLRDQLDLTDAERETLARNSIKASFASDARKAQLLRG
jgi:adenosine deaminase